MKHAIQILFCLTVLAILVLTIIAPGLTEGLAMLGLFLICIVVAVKQGMVRAVVLFLKEMW